MDFIERWFGVSPDGGDGSLEITLVIVALVVLATPLLVIKLRSVARRSGRTNER
jgi:hypothetical protein